MEEAASKILVQVISLAAALIEGMVGCWEKIVNGYSEAWGAQAFR